MRQSVIHLMVFCLIALLPACALAAAKSAEAPKTVTPEAFYMAMLLEAEKGDVQAMMNLGLLYEQGIGVPKNFTLALSWYEKAGDAGSADGNFRAGLGYEVGMGTVSNLAKAVEYYEKAVAAEFPQAQHRMASLHMSGRGVPRDDAKGIDLLTKTARTGNGSAANELGYIYLNGMFGQKKDTDKARDWFTKSAEAGNLEGMKNLAVMLKDGIGKKADPAGALRWYLIAQKGGLRTSDLDDVIAGLKKNLKSAQIKEAENAAEKWVTDYTAKNAPKNK